MASLIEQRTRHFYTWERAGRGWRSYSYPVRLEPPFAPFRYFNPASAPRVDDGRHPTELSLSFDRLLGGGQAQTQLPAKVEEAEVEPEPWGEGERSELRLFPPEGLSVTPALSAALLQSLSRLRAPVSFELAGESGRVSVILTAERHDVAIVRSQLEAFFPELVIEGREDTLSLWQMGREGTVSLVEFGLAREFMIPLAVGKQFSPDPLTSIVAALSQAQEGEVSLFQVLFTGVRAPWETSILRATQTPSGEPFFADLPELTAWAREKASHPLFAVLIRLAVRAEREERLWTLLRAAGTALSTAMRGGNDLVPLAADDLSALFGDLLFRTTHRPGFILSLPELVSLVHIPAESVPRVVREGMRTKRLPPDAQGEGVFLGVNRHQRDAREARLSSEERMRHTHIVGASGTGKSTLLVSLILQDIARGAGVGVLDPHGDLIDEVLARLPDERAEDTILFDPADPGYAVGWNMLSAHSESEKEMLASDLVAVFQRLSTSWGDQMTAVLSNATLAFLESERGGTLLDLRRFLFDPAFRKDFLATVRDPYVADFWRVEYPLLSGTKSLGPILTRLDVLLRSKLLRAVVTAQARPLDFRRVVDDGRIFLARLSQGAIGEENAALLGSLLVSKLHQVSLLRQDREEGRRRPFFLYLDEFHNLATPSMAALFSGARKYRLSLTVAHQDLYQLRSKVPEVERSVLANAHTRICFRLGEEDARTLGAGFSFFTPEDLGNLGIGEAICRIGGRDSDFNLSTAPLSHLDPAEARERREELRLRSLTRWGTTRESIEREPTPEPAVRPPEVTPDREERERIAAPESVALVPAAPAPRVEALPAESVPAEESGVRLPGKGGPEHTYLQELIRRWAEERGFRASVEEQISGSRESIDVALYRGSLRIACEVSVTTPLEYEVGNVEKCLAAGFGKVAVLSLKKERLKKLRALLFDALSEEERSRVFLFTPEEFLAWLSNEPVHEEEKTVRGYRVRVRYGKGGGERTKRVAAILARSMSRLERDD